MKKFFYSLVVMAVSMISSMSFVSCSSDDDAVSSKDMVGCAIYEFTQDVLDIYNVKMTATSASGESYGTYNFNTMTPVKTDAQGVKMFMVEFMIKEFPVELKVESTCSKKLSDLNDDKRYDLTHSSISGAYKEKGEGLGKLSLGLKRSIMTQSGVKMKEPINSGLTFYEEYVKSLNLLSSTIKR